MYNYVIFGTDWDLYKIAYSDLNKVNNVKYIPTPYEFRNHIFKLLYRLHCSPRINKIINLPFKSIWNSGYFRNDFKNNKPICFIFFSNWYDIEKRG